MLVWCLVIEDDKTILGRFYIQTSNYSEDLSIDGLKKVLTRRKELLEDVDSSLLMVYHSSAIHVDMDPDTLETALRDLDLEKAEVSPTKVVTEVVTGIELLIFKKPAPATRTSSKHARSPSPEIDNLSRLKRAKILWETRSHAALFALYKSIQTDSSERILDDRPQPDLGIAPISLLYGPFGEFDDIYSGRAPLPVDMIDDVHIGLFERNLNPMADDIFRCYADGDERALWSLPVRWEMFYHMHEPSRGECFASVYRMNFFDELVATTANCKFEVTSVPYLESVGCIAHSHAHWDILEDVCNRWRIPALSVVINGYQVQFFAILLLGHQYRVVSLTPELSLSPSATNGWDRKHLYRAFAAAYVLQRRIHRDLELYMKASESLPPVFAGQEYFLPAISKICEHGRKNDDQYIEFKIFDYYGPKERNRQLYLAKVSNGGPTIQDTRILVKFSQRYSIELHDFCVETGHAPKVYGYECLPGGWFAIAMEFLAGAEPMQSHLYSNQKEESLVKLVEGFHAKDLVHGDLRSVNILCDESSDKIWLTGFDWGGKAGEVEYPMWNLNKELRSGRQAKDLIIRKEDDVRILHATLKALRSK